MLVTTFHIFNSQIVYLSITAYSAINSIVDILDHEIGIVVTQTLFHRHPMGHLPYESAAHLTCTPESANALLVMTPLSSSVVPSNGPAARCLFSNYMFGDNHGC
jgi:hypothetical protein